MKSVPKLCYIHNITMPGPEANTVHVAKMCSAFAQNGCDVTLIAGAKPGERDFAGHLRKHYGLQHAFSAVPLLGIAKKPSLAALYGASYARLNGADVVYTRAPHVGLAAASMALPVIFEIHTDESAFSDVGRAALQRLMQQPRLLGAVVISEPLAEYMRERFPGRRVIVAHDGADPQPNIAARRTSTDKVRVGYVGHLYRGRGVELLVELASLCPWADISIVGGTPADLARWRATQTPSNLSFLGPVPHAEVPARIADFDVVVAPYQHAVFAADGKTDTSRWMSPLKLFEYMAMGAPIVASDMPAIRDILTDGETALLVDAERADAWAVALMRLKESPYFRNALGDAARAQFLKHHTWSARANYLLDAFGLGRDAARAA